MNYSLVNLVSSFGGVGVIWVSKSKSKPKNEGASKSPDGFAEGLKVYP